MGFEADPRLLGDPNSPLLAAAVQFSGCSASFVSELGLFVTNHHCAVRALEYNSKPEENLIKSGFIARKPSDERSAGPSARLSITRSMRDVTAEVQAELTRAPDDIARAFALESAQKRLVAGCEAGQPGRRCQLASFYAGRTYLLIERQELRDLRIVYAPADGLGNFGGEIDNWRWPRHTADFAFFRAYVGPDGQPREFASDNVPYRAAHWLRLARSGLKAGDPVWVLGFPGRTARARLRREVEETLNFTYPYRLNLFEEYLQRLEELGSRDAELRIKATSLVRGFNNYRTKHRGEIEGMQRGKLLELKQQEERALLQALASDAARSAELQRLLAEVDAAFDALRPTREMDASLEFELSRPRLLAAATRIVRMAEERKRPDAERDPEYQERNGTALRDELRSLLKAYYQPLDQALLELALTRMSRSEAAQPGNSSPLLDLFIGKAVPGKDRSPGIITQSVAALYSRTRLADEKRLLQLFESATPEQLSRDPDPLLRLAVKLRPFERAADLRRKNFTGRMLRLAPAYLGAVLATHAGPVAPDANGTLRISYGRLGGHKPSPPSNNSVFTWLSEIPAKHTGQPPFDAPRALLERIGSSKQAYLDPSRHDVPVNFLSDANITNGSSGSPTLNGRGELVGLAFDGTYESVASDWLVDPNSRSIHVDLRYMLFLLDQVENATELLRELQVEP